MPGRRVMRPQPGRNDTCPAGPVWRNAGVVTCSRKTRDLFIRIKCGVVIAVFGFVPAVAQVRLAPPESSAGYVARLLINEAPFPGERGWESEADSKAAMRQILLVLDARLRHVPAGYTQRQIATVQTNDIIDIMTAGGEHGQVDGFYRDEAGRLVTVPRVRTRIDYLLGIASKGQPGMFARLLQYAQALASAYLENSPPVPDLFVRLRTIAGAPVTGRAYSWMTDTGEFHPGGRFVRIPDEDQGGLGGNRFFTLTKPSP